MPKRFNRFYLDTPKSTIKKIFPQNQNISIDDETGEGQTNQNSEEQDDGDNSSAIEKNLNGSAGTDIILRKTKIKRCMKYNTNSEIERLLLHNSSSLTHRVDHCDFPSFNVGIWPQDNDELLAAYPSCAFSVPRPIYVADGLQEKTDLCYKRPLIAEFYKKRMGIARTAYQTALKKQKALRAAEKDEIYQPSVFEFAERTLLQPDTYFTGSYDYYYSGGNLSILPGTGSVVHASGKNLQTLELSEFPMLEDYTVTSSLRPVAKYTSSEDCEIFEVRPMVTAAGSSRQNCFFVRQRNVISVNFLTASKQLKILTQFRTKSTPFISFSQSERDHNKFLITTMKQHVRYYDLDSSSPRLVKLFEIEPKATNVSWNTIKPWRENTFLYANDYKFCLIDIRTTPDQWMTSATSVIEHNSLCDHISAIKPSEFNNIFYVATNHKLHCMDIRQIKSFSLNEPEAVICRWTHQMQHAPLLMDSYRLGNNEYIALSSPVAGELHICELSRKRNEEKLSFEVSNRVPKHVFGSWCLPYQPPTLMESYECAKLAGKCLQPESNLRVRLQACTTGLSFSETSFEGNDPGLGLLLTSNSLGDIFLHTLTKREGQEGDSRGDARSNEVMAEFAEKLATPKPPLNYTCIKNLKALRKVFLCKRLNTERKVELDDMDDSFSDNENQLPLANRSKLPAKRKRKRLHLGRWQKSFASLHSYKDALVKDLLSIWDIEMEDEKTIRLGNLSSGMRMKPDPGMKVRDWLDTYPTDNLPMTSIPSREASKYTETTEASGLPNISMDFNETQNTMDFENAIQSTQIVDTALQFDISAVDPAINTTTVSKKKSKKYVKGF